MARINFEVSDELHRQIKAMATLHGMNIKEFVMDRLMKPGKKAHSKGKKPNARLLRAIRNVEQKKNLIHYANFEDLVADWRKDGLL